MIKVTKGKAKITPLTASGEVLNVTHENTPDVWHDALEDFFDSHIDNRLKVVNNKRFIELTDKNPSRPKVLVDVNRIVKIEQLSRWTMIVMDGCPVFYVWENYETVKKMILGE